MNKEEMIIKKDSFVEYLNIIALKGNSEVKQVIFNIDAKEKSISTLAPSPTAIIVSNSIFLLDKKSTVKTDEILGIEDFSLFRKIINSFKGDYIILKKNNNYLNISSVLDNYEVNLILADPDFITKTAYNGFDVNKFKEKAKELENEFSLSVTEKNNFLTAISSLGSDDIVLEGSTEKLNILSNKKENNIIAYLKYSNPPKESFKVRLSTIIVQLLSTIKTDIKCYAKTDNLFGLEVNVENYSVMFMIAPIIENVTEGE